MAWPELVPGDVKLMALPLPLPLLLNNRITLYYFLAPNADNSTSLFNTWYVPTVWGSVVLSLRSRFMAIWPLYSHFELYSLEQNCKLIILYCHWIIQMTRSSHFHKSSISPSKVKWDTGASLQHCSLKRWNKIRLGTGFYPREGHLF